MCENEISNISLLSYISTAFLLSLSESEVQALVGSLLKLPKISANVLLFVDKDQAIALSDIPFWSN